MLSFRVFLELFLALVIQIRDRAMIDMVEKGKPEVVLGERADSTEGKNLIQKNSSICSLGAHQWVMCTEDMAITDFIVEHLRSRDNSSQNNSI